jgi:predicted phosphoribosyltransferase
VATGATIQAGILFLRKKKAGKIIVAVPVVSEGVFQGLFKFADDVVAVLTPRQFHAIGEFYGNFEQLTDDEVLQLLDRQ